MQFILFLALLIGPKLILPGNNLFAAGLSTLAIVIWSASLNTSLGYGAYLMITLPFCWAIFGSVWLAYYLYDKQSGRHSSV